MNERTLTPNEEFVINFYRYSELTGSIFFGGLARAVPDGPIMIDLTRHYADEARHAQLWTACLVSLGATPRKVARAYQDGYLAAAGLPVNITEILAVTYVFERRVTDQYGRHLRAPSLHPAIKRNLRDILRDEGWHLHWIGKELDRIAERDGPDRVNEALTRYRTADQKVFSTALQELETHLDFPVVSDQAAIAPSISKEEEFGELIDARRHLRRGH
jgi:hypothetical protein